MIKPLLKEGKDPKSPGSFRPIALTACLGKLLEKIITNRLSVFMEDNNLLNPNQAGFRKKRCTTDQVLKLVQMAFDKIHQNKQGSTTLVTFFDFSRAYDKVWREGLISKMIKMGIPFQFIKYTRLFLSGRRTVVDINGVKSRPFYLNDGLPQGSAISPLLFLLFINDITDHTKDGATPSLFADDTAIWIAGSRNKQETIKEMQANINGISEWSKKWKMVLNSDKTQVMVITLDKKDSDWIPKLELEGKVLKVVKEYRFLGVTIDSKLTFSSHVKNVIDKGKKRNKIMRCLAGKDWGRSSDAMKALYSTYIRSALEYASPAWYPWISKTARKKLERVQNEALRIMTRMTKDTPEEFLQLQAGIEPLNSRMRKNNLVLREKYMRLQPGDTRKELAEKSVKRRIKTRVGWREESKEQTELVINRKTEKASVDPMTPLNISITEVKLEKKKECYTEQELRQQTECKIAEIDAEIEIFTDGSTAGNQQNGGAGVFAQDKNGNTLLEMSKPAGSMCSSYDGETVACIEALRWISSQSSQKSYAIYTDSKSMVQSLSSNDYRDTHEWIRVIKNMLQNIKHNITLCWVPSHCGTFGNERADKLADQGAKMNQQDAPVTFSIVRAKVKSSKWEIGHGTDGRAAEMFGERRSTKTDERSWPEKIKQLFGRIRCGHAKELKSYQKRIGLTDCGTCTYCDMDEQETVEHVLCKCPQLELARRELWPNEFNMKMMVINSDVCLKLLGRRYPALRRPPIGESSEQ